MMLTQASSNEDKMAEFGMDAIMIATCGRCTFTIAWRSFWRQVCLWLPADVHEIP